jgi:putative transcriptional regulator
MAELFRKPEVLLKKGSILLARNELEDPNFTATVVLLSVYTDETIMGLVCNRPSHMPLCEIFSVDTPQKFDRQKIYIGGPVAQDSLQILQITDTPVEEAHKIAENIFLGGKWGSLNQILDADPDRTRLFLGYAGWSPGQLENEIRLGAWDIYNIDLIKLLLGPEELMMQEDVDAIQQYLSSIR